MLYNINPALWGPHCWKFLHYLTMAYPENPTKHDKDAIINFFNAFKYIIPCEKCRIHFALNLQKFPLNDDALKNKISLATWLMNIHNQVNEQNGKTKYTINDVLKEYETKQSFINKIKTELITIGLVILIMILLAIHCWYF